MTSLNRNDQLIEILSRSLGSYKKSKDGNEVIFHCPNCHHHKLKLNIELNKNIFHCWVCDYSGYGIHKLVNNKEDELLLKKLTNYKFKSSSDIFKKDELKEEFTLSLPKNFQYLANKKNNPIYKNIYNYAINKRNLNDNIINKYNLGYVNDPTDKIHYNRLIIPSYNENGKVNYYVARSIYDNKFKYYNPPANKTAIIPFELYIAWDFPIVLVEGMFDAIAVDNNAIPLLGNTVNMKIINNIIEYKTPKIYLYLDEDAQKFVYRNCEKLIEYGINPKIATPPEGKDPGNLTKEENAKILKNYEEYNFNTKIKYKTLSKLK